MESPDKKTRKLTGRLLLVLCAVILASASLRQFSSSFVQILTSRQDKTLRVAVFTRPAMLFTYNPATRQVLATVSGGKCNDANPQTCFEGDFDRYFIASREEQSAFWEGFKYALAMWRFNPLIAARVMGIYIAAAHDRRTNLSPAEFFLLVREISTLNVNDFAIKYPAKSAKKGKPAKNADHAAEISPEKMVSFQREDSPLIVEIFNASGTKGLAQKLTQYLREQNNKGLLRVDVLDYGNFPTVEPKSYVEDYSGRLLQAAQIARAVGISSEIKSVSAPDSICHSRIILGKDFQMPL